MLSMSEGIAHRILEQALVNTGYRIWSRSPHLDIDDEVIGTEYELGHLDIRGSAHIIILDEDADNEVVGWQAATHAVQILGAF